MKRKTSAVPTRIWTFGGTLKGGVEIENADLLHAELRAGHHYYNALVRIYRDARNLYRAARSRLCPPLAGVEQQIIALGEAFRAAPAGSEERTRLLAELKPLQAEAAELRETMKKDKALAEEAKSINNVKFARVRAARAERTSWFGTGALVEKAAEEAASKARFDPRFHPWRRRGRVGMQLHREKWDDVIAGRSRMLRIELVPFPPSDRRVLGSKRSQKRQLAVAHLRVGTRRDNGKPIALWASIPIVLHRMPPPGSILTWAWAKAVPFGSRTRWDLQLCIEHAAFAARPQGFGTVAIDLGWRSMPDGIRVAYCVDDAGSQFELRVPQLVVDRLDRCERLNSIRSRAFDEIRAALKAATERAEEPFPDWLAAEMRHISKWRSPGKIAALAHRWSAETDAGPALEEMWRRWYAERGRHQLWDSTDVVRRWAEQSDFPSPTLLCLSLWLRQDEHLWRWVSGEHRKALACREDLYKQFAYWIGNRYATVVVESRPEPKEPAEPEPIAIEGQDGVAVYSKPFDLRELARADAAAYAELYGEHATAIRRVRNRAAPGMLRQHIIRVLDGGHHKKDPPGSHRVRVAKIENSTRECFECSHISSWEEQSPLVLTCHGCGRSWDQDLNAARILLRRYSEGSGDPQSPSPARPRKQRAKGALDGRVDAADAAE